MNTTAPAAVEHHESHDNLLIAVDAVEGVHVDAVIVPTNRTPDHLTTAVALARELRSTLVVLCSGKASADKTVDLARGVDLIAVDVDSAPRVLPSFETTRLLAGTDFDRRTDTSLKRNLGLVVARLMAWDRIAFLDDDITVPVPADLELAAGTVSPVVAAVGLRVGGFPDNSVVCHAHRATGGDQGTFIGGGALVIGQEATESFFPTIYNEDWFFLLDDFGLRGSALVGAVEQKKYDPFANDLRAQVEEFGDCLAEGVFALLDEDRYDEAGDVGYWGRFLRGRLALIDEILGRVRDDDRGEDDALRMEVALLAARKQCEAITPERCVAYLEALRVDRRGWREFVWDLDEQHDGRMSGAPSVLEALQLTDCARYVPAA